MLPEKWDDHLQKIHALSHDEAEKVFFVVVVPGVDDHLAETEELTQLVQARNALRALRDGEIVGDLIAGSVAFSACPIGLADEADGEASLSVYKTKTPAELNQPFLL